MNDYEEEKDYSDQEDVSYSTDEGGQFYYHTDTFGMITKVYV